MNQLRGSSNSNEVGNMTLERMKIDDKFYDITKHLQTTYNGRFESFKYITTKKVLDYFKLNKKQYNSLKDELNIKPLFKITTNKDVEHILKSGRMVDADVKKNKVDKINSAIDSNKVKKQIELYNSDGNYDERKKGLKDVSKKAEKLKKEMSNKIGITETELLLKSERSDMLSIDNYMKCLGKYFEKKTIKVDGKEVTVFADKNSIKNHNN